LRNIAFLLVLTISAPAFADPAVPAPDTAKPETTPVPKAKNGEPITQELNPYVPWYRGKYGHNRVVHLSLTAGLGVMFLVSETLLKPTLAAGECRWCSPPAFDASVRNALVWHDTNLANFLSTMDAYVLAPIVGFGLLIAADSDASWSRLIDDTLPVAETIAISESITQIIKFSVGRQRPYAHFGNPNAPVGSDDNTSFLSGHSVLGFSITASAGLICHWRGYWTEPYVWATGIALSLSTEYFRIGADKHYLSDVVAGGVLGIASGLLVPRLMRRDIKIVPVANGAAVVGSF
jgi:membrane-associated phospholipid phosphatase